MTVRFLADEDLDSGIIEGLRSLEPAIDILDAKEAGLRGTKDPVILELAGQNLPYNRSGLRSRMTARR